MVSARLGLRRGEQIGDDPGMRSAASCARAGTASRNAAQTSSQGQHDASCEALLGSHDAAARSLSSAGRSR